MADACSVDGCQRPIYGRQEWCEMHYRRVLRTGKTGPPGPVTRAQGCIVDGCDASHDARGYCHGHYQRLQRTGDAGTTPLREGERMCSVEGCERPHKARGFCAAHYKRVLASGDPRPDEPIRAVKGIHEHKGYRFVPVPDRYRHLSDDQTMMQEHRLVVAKAIGRPLLPDEQVHHKNGNRLDNRLSNLELWSTSHPSGARIEDLIEYAIRILARYAATGIPQRLGHRFLNSS